MEVRMSKNFRFEIQAGWNRTGAIEQGVVGSSRSYPGLSNSIPPDTSICAGRNSRVDEMQ